MLKIATLGGVSIAEEDSPVKGFITRKVEALLVYLACEPREHRREWLGDFFWDDLTQERTMGNLRTILSNLNQQLGDYIITTRQTVAFNTRSPFWLDIAQLEPAIQQAEQHRKHYHRLSRPVAAQLTEAVALYKGDFLAGFYVKDCRGFEGWKALQQERYRSRTIEALGWLVEYETEQRQYSAAIQHARRILELDPMLEEAHRALMELYVLADQRAAALAQYEKCVQILEEELALEPDDKTRELYYQILAGTTTAAPPPPKPEHHLPVPATPFVPRTADLAQIHTCLNNPECRLLTLIGMGGMGKTRLALQAAREALENYQDGVYFVNLAGVSTPDGIDYAILNTFKIQVEGANVHQEMLNYLENKEMLLILDNFEHLIEGAPLLDDILSHASQVRLLVTSREKLNLYGEWAIPIEGLPLPESDTLVENPGVQLFLQAARRAKPAFKLEGSEQAVMKICKLVAGMPLGLELAGAWVAMMSPEDIACKIKEDLAILSVSLRNIPERHRSIHQLFNYSWNLLAPEEQDCLMRLTVFRGSFDLPAAVQVGNASLPILLALAEKSLIKVAAPGYYTMHELLKQYAAERLAQAGLMPTTYQQHACYFVEFLAASAKSESYTVMEQINTHYEDIRAAMLWAEQYGEYTLLLRLCESLGEYWDKRGYVSEGRAWLRRALAIAQGQTSEPLFAAVTLQAGILAWRQSDWAEAEPLLLQASAMLEHREDSVEELLRTLNYLGHLMLNKGNFEMARAYYERIIEVAEPRQMRRELAKAMGNLGLLLSETAQFDAANDYLRQSLEINRSLNNLQGVGVLLSNLGTVALHQHDYVRARAYYEESYQVGVQQGNKLQMLIAQINLGEVLHNLHEYQLAYDYYRAGLQELVAFGDKLSLIGTLESIAFLLVDLEMHPLAIELLGAMAATRRQHDAPLPPREQERYDQYHQRLQQAVDPATFATTWERGSTISLDSATALVLRENIAAV